MAGEPYIPIVGSLGGDPELRFTPGGKAVVNFSVAVASRKKDSDGSWVDDCTTWYRCSAWNQLAENIAETFIKGMRVFVYGKLKQRNWEGKDGTKGSTLEVQVDHAGPELRFATAKVNRLQRQDDARAQANWSTDSPSDEIPF